MENLMVAESNIADVYKMLRFTPPINHLFVLPWSNRVKFLFELALELRYALKRPRH